MSWGLDDYDQVGNTPGGNGFTAIAGGAWHSLALKTDGSIVSWGLDDYDQVGNTPSGNDFTAIAGGGLHSLAINNVVPEPSTLAIWSLLGLCGFGVYRRRASARMGVS